MTTEGDADTVAKFVGSGPVRVIPPAVMTSGTKIVVDMVNHPPHYRHPSGIECIEVARLCSNDMGAVVQYIWRYENKDGERDLRKARWYLNDILTTGQAAYLPHKAAQKLRKVNDFEPIGSLRFKVFSCLLNGDLRGAITLITETVGEG